MPTLAVNDIDMAYADHDPNAGRGEDVLLLLVHGFPLDRSMWAPVIELLGGEFRVIAPDLRGYGQTSLGDVDETAGVTMLQYADDLAALLVALDISQPVVYCGFSMGGYIGWQFAQQHAERLRALAMCDTRASADSEEARGMRLKMASHVSEWGGERVAEAMLPKLFAAATLESNAPIVQQTQSTIASCDPRAIAAAQRGMAARPDMTPMLANITVPAIGVVGVEDALTTPAEMAAMVAAMPDAKLTQVAGAGHMTPIENPPAVAAALRSLVERL